MAVSLADQILRKIGEARELYHRLILMVGPAGSGSSRPSPGRRTSPWRSASSTRSRYTG